MIITKWLKSVNRIDNYLDDLYFGYIFAPAMLIIKHITTTKRRSTAEG